MKIKNSIVITLFLGCLTLQQTQQKANLDSLGLGQLNDAAEFEMNKLSGAFNIEGYVQSWQALIKLFGGSDEETKRQEMRKHMNSGVLRSAEGTVEEIMQKRKEIEERQMLQEKLESGEYSEDPEIQKKLYDLYLKHHNLNSVRNDDVDLTPYRNHKIVSPLSLQQVNEQQYFPAEGRVLQETVNILQLTESYPSECKNGGQLLNQIQTYYLCVPKEDVTNVLRVDKATYQNLKNNFTTQFDCITQNITKQVCMCSQGFYDFQCGTQLFRQCFVNITDPPLYKGCQKEDSPYYLYSVPGFDPCFYLDFTEVQNIKYILTCKYTGDISGIDPVKENLGYAYRDVIQMDTPQTFNYVAQNNKTGMKAMSEASARSILARVTIYDWKWLSKPAYFQETVIDPEVLVGIKESVIAVDFPTLMKNDSIGLTKFVAGGRAYFETDALSSFTFSFTSKGFFDQKDYVEPAAQPKNTWKIIVGVLVPGVVIGAVVSIIFYTQWKKRNAKKLKELTDHID